MAVISGMGEDVGASASATAYTPQSYITTRAANFARGVFVAESQPVDPLYRVQLTEAGDAVIAKNPDLARARAALPVSRQRGFTWSAAVARGGLPSSSFLSYLWGPWIGGGGVRIAVDPEIKAGFEIGMAAAAPAALAPVIVTAVIGPSSGPCGAEPARRPSTGIGPALYVDTVAGARYNACLEAAQTAKEKAIYDAIVNRSAGGADGCGPEPAYNTTSAGAKSYVGTGSPYSGAPLGAAWAACRAAAAAKNSPPIVPGSPQVIPAGLVSSSDSGTPQTVLSPEDFGTAPPPAAARPTAFNFGPTEAERAPRATTGLEVAAGVGAVLLAGWFLHSRGFF